MSDSMTFNAGKNIAIKTPAHEFEQTAAFYRDILKLPVHIEGSDSISFQFGIGYLWVDRMVHMSQAEVWLEIECENSEQAAQWLADNKVQRCDRVETLPDNVDGFWVVNPAGLVHLIHTGRQGAHRDSIADI